MTGPGALLHGTTRPHRRPQPTRALAPATGAERVTPTPTHERGATWAFRPVRSPRWQLPIFVALALSWWPWAGQLANPDSAVVIPIGPSIAAILIVGWIYGRPSRRAWLRSIFSPRIGRAWWAAAIPFVVAVTAALAAVLLGADAPSGSELAGALLALTVLPLILVVNGPLGEEIGWRGFVLPVLLRRHSPLVATALLVPVWWLFHLPLVLTSPDRFGVGWAASVAGIAFVMTWMHLRSRGSVLLAVVFHAVANTVSPAAIRMFDGADSTLVVGVYATIWLAVGAVAAVSMWHGGPATVGTTGR
jgi:uncharacterized protein